jgi:hypothetical protein
MFRRLVPSSWLPGGDGGSGGSGSGGRARVGAGGREDSVSSSVSDGSAAIEDELEMAVLSEEQRALLLASWKIIYSKMGSSLCYASGTSSDGSDAGIAETFLHLFQEYPRSQEFFARFRNLPVEALRSDKRLATALQEHAVRVMRVVEKVVGR